MTPWQALSYADKDNISVYINEFSEMDSGRIATLDKILALWNKNKQNIFDKFGQQLILEKEVSFNKSDDDRYREYDETISETERAFLRTIRRAILNYGDNDRDNYYTIDNVFMSSNLISSRYIGIPGKIEMPDGSILRINPNDKNMRLIHKLGKAYAPDQEAVFERLRINLSKITDNKIDHGTYCLSIHPLDYMTMSDNTYNWTSCMNWMEDGGGCYRRGTVEMMNSPLVVVAYVRGDDELSFGWNNSWNSKRWRNLFIIDEQGVITEVRAYPYHEPSLTQIGLDWLSEIFGFGETEDVVLSNDDYNAGICAIKVDNNEVGTIRFTTRAMYNDFRYIHKAKITSADKVDGLRIQYSAPATCMCCGRTEDYSWGDEHWVLCENCQPGLRCASCGCIVSEDDAYYDENGDVYCYDCWNDNFVHDDIHDTNVPVEESFSVRLSKTDEQGIKTAYSIDSLIASDCSYDDLFNYEGIEKWKQENGHTVWSDEYIDKREWYHEKYPAQYEDTVFIDINDASAELLREFWSMFFGWHRDLWSFSREKMIEDILGIDDGTRRQYWRNMTAA